VEAEVQGELCEDEVLRQQAVGLGELRLVLRGRRDQAGLLLQAWWTGKGRDRKGRDREEGNITTSLSTGIF